MNAYDAIFSYWENCPDETRPITIDEAAAELEHLRQEARADPHEDADYWGWLDALTPEQYRDIWNGLC